MLTLKIGSETSLKKFEDQPHDKTFIPASYSSVTARARKAVLFQFKKMVLKFLKVVQ